jgi:hypothetical protein
MRTFTVPEAQQQLSRIIADVNRGDVIVLKDGDQQVTLFPGAILELEEDSPELEAELLKTANGPFTPYSRKELREYTEQLIQKHRSK